MAQQSSKSASVVDHTAHSAFSRSSSPGIEIDPRHPDEATVFALLVNPAEIDRFRDQLKAALPDLVEESPLDPGIVTQLADIGHVQAFPAAPLADVLISREALALRTNVAGSTDNAGPAASQGVDVRHSAEVILSNRRPERGMVARRQAPPGRLALRTRPTKRSWFLSGYAGRTRLSRMLALPWPLDRRGNRNTTVGRYLPRRPGRDSRISPRRSGALEAVAARVFVGHFLSRLGSNRLF